MNLVAQIEAALNGKTTQTQASIDAQAITLSDARTALGLAQSEAVTTTDELVTAQALLNQDIENGNDTSSSQASLNTAQESKDLSDAAVLAATTDVANALPVDWNDVLMTLIDKLKVTDYNMISNDTLKLILAAQNREVLFDEPESVISNFAMELVAPSTIDVTPVGK